MTHINIGAALGLAAWVLWSGFQVVTGQVTPAYRVTEVRALMHLAHAGGPVAMQLVPAQASGQQPTCHPAQPTAVRAGRPLSEVDL